MTLVRDDVTSLYEQIATTLHEEIGQGMYAPSGKLPSEAELSERFGVSRVTVRLAVGKHRRCARGRAQAGQGHLREAITAAASA